LAFDREGEIYLQRDLPIGVLYEFAVGDVTGDARREIVVPGENGKTDGALLLDDEGRLIRNFRTEHYLTAWATVDIDGDGKHELVLYGWPNEARDGTFEVFRGSGERVQKWDAPGFRQRDFTVVPARDGTASILGISVAENTLVWRAFDGRIVEQLRVPFVGCFKFIHQEEIGDGTRVFLLSGGGYNQNHMVVVVDRNGELVYQEIGDGHAEAIHVPDLGRDTFLVSIRNQVWRYSRRLP
jgi:hypothetical protein